MHRIHKLSGRYNNVEWVWLPVGGVSANAEGNKKGGRFASIRLYLSVKREGYLATAFLREARRFLPALRFGAAFFAVFFAAFFAGFLLATRLAEDFFATFLFLAAGRAAAFEDFFLERLALFAVVMTYLHMCWPC
jgi:hypothetical protein